LRRLIHHDNDSDIFTKNTTSKIHHRHNEKLIWTKEGGIQIRSKTNHDRKGLEKYCESVCYYKTREAYIW